MYVLLAKQKHNSENRENFIQKIPVYSNPESITTMKRKPACSFEEKVKMKVCIKPTFNPNEAKTLLINHIPQKKRKLHQNSCE